MLLEVMLTWILQRNFRHVLSRDSIFEPMTVPRMIHDRATFSATVVGGKIYLSGGCEADLKHVVDDGNDVTHVTAAAESLILSLKFALK